MISQATAFPECSQTCPRVAELEEKIQELEEELIIKEERNKRLWNKLRKHENPHTPLVGGSDPPRGGRGPPEKRNPSRGEGMKESPGPAPSLTRRKYSERSAAPTVERNLANHRTS